MHNANAQGAITPQPVPTDDSIRPSGNTSILVEIFDPPMCCPTGLCGPTLDQSLLDANQMVQSLKDDGIQVARYQMSTHPHMFLKHPEIMRMVRERGMEVFPVTVIGGNILKSGSYPTRTEIDQALLQTAGAII